MFRQDEIRIPYDELLSAANRIEALATDAANDQERAEGASAILEELRPIFSGPSADSVFAVVPGALSQWQSAKTPESVSNYLNELADILRKVVKDTKEADAAAAEKIRAIFGR